MMMQDERDKSKNTNNSEKSLLNRNSIGDVKASPNQVQYSNNFFLPDNHRNIFPYDLPYNNLGSSYSNFAFQSKKDNLRKGKWTMEEEQYTSKIIEAFNNGLLKLPESAYGITLRTYLAEKLFCDPMRITKKYTGASCLGKRVYHKDSLVASAEDIEKTKQELNYLELKFLEKLEQIRRERRESESVLEEMYNQITVSTPNIDAMIYPGRQIAVPFQQTHNIAYNYAMPSMFLPTHPGYMNVSNGSVPSNPYMRDRTVTLAHDKNSMNGKTDNTDPRIIQFSNNIGLTKTSPSNIKASTTTNSKSNLYYGPSSNNKNLNSKKPKSLGNSISNSINTSSIDSLQSSSGMSSSNTGGSFSSLENVHDNANNSDGTTDEDAKTDVSDDKNMTAKGNKDNTERSDSITSNSSSSSNSDSNNSNEYMIKTKRSYKKRNNDKNNNGSAEDHAVASTLLGLFYDINKSSSHTELVQFVEDVQNQQIERSQSYSDIIPTKKAENLKRISSTDDISNNNTKKHLLPSDNYLSTINKKMKRSHLSFSSLPFLT